MEGAIRLFEDHKSKNEIIRRSQIDNQREKEKHEQELIKLF